MFSLMWGLWEYLTTRAEVRVLVVGLERAGKTSLLERIKAACAEGAADGAGGLSGLGTGGLGGLGGAAASSPSSSAAATPSASSSSSSSSLPAAPALVPPLPSPPPTIGMNLARVRTAGVTLVLWDVGGSMRGIWDQYYAQADCVLFVVDASERARFGEAASTLELVLQRSAELGGGGGMGGGGGGGGSDAGAAHGAPRTALPVVVLANKQDRLGAARAAEVLELVCRPAGLLQAGGGSVGGGVGGSSGAGSGGASAGADLRRESRIFETSAQTLAGVRDAIDFTVGAAKAFSASRA